MAMRQFLAGVAGVTRVTSSPAMRVAIGAVLIIASFFDLMDTARSVPTTVSNPLAALHSVLRSHAV
jgi:hypothetical protein